MQIRSYRDHPVIWSPDPGEIIYARRAHMDRYVLAIVEKAWRNRAGHLRMRVMWLEEDPYASPGERANNDLHQGEASMRLTGPGDTRPVAPMEIGWMTVRGPASESPLIKQVDRDSLPRQVVSRKPSASSPSSA